MIDENVERDEEQLVKEQLLTYIEADDIQQFREQYFALHPYEQAQFYEKVTPDIREKIYHYLSPEELAEVFQALELEDDEYVQFLNEMDVTYAAAMLSEMNSDDVVDVLNELDDDDREHYLTLMDDETVEEIHDLLQYADYTAGAIMTTEYVAINENSTTRSAMHILRNEAPTAETIYYLFITNMKKQLVGVISLRDLIVADEDVLIRDVMNERVVSVHANDDQEEVAQIMRDYNFLALPVIDDDQTLLGIITVDDIIDVIDEEAEDDYSKLAGISDLDNFEQGPLAAAKKRLPWLIILLFLGMLTASLMAQFEHTLDAVAVLAIFIPLISGTSGNSGTQALAVAIRGLATKDAEKSDSKVRLLIRELSTGAIMGVLCALVVTGIVYVWKGELVIGMLVGVAMCCSIIVATLAGSLIPLLMDRLGVDPAVASGPFITTLNDITSILIYLGLATMFIL
ncbi:MAG: magnesium transporter [Caryophanon sp.]|nr:magnesium transporter [Caryophanon sp.]